MEQESIDHPHDFEFVMKEANVVDAHAGNEEEDSDDDDDDDDDESIDRPHDFEVVMKEANVVGAHAGDEEEEEEVSEDDDDDDDDDDRTSADIIGCAIWKSSGPLSRRRNVEIAKEVYELAQRKRYMEEKFDTFADTLEFIRTEIGDLATVLDNYTELRTVHLALYDELRAFYPVPSTDVNKALEDDSTDDDDDEESPVTVVIPDSNATSSSALSCSPPSKKSSIQVTATQKQTTTKKGNTQQRVPQKMTYDELRAFYPVPSTDVNKALEDDSTDDDVLSNIMRGEDAK